MAQNLLFIHLLVTLGLKISWFISYLPFFLHCYDGVFSDILNPFQTLKRRCIASDKFAVIKQNCILVHLNFVYVLFFLLDKNQNCKEKKIIY